MRTLAGLPLVFVLAACTSQSSFQLPEADVYVNSGQPFTLQVGQTAGVGTSLTIDLVHFSAVLQDNRCPADVQCVAAGAATVLLSVQSALNVQDVTLDVPPEGTAEVVVDELTITSFGVRPSAQEGVTIAPLDYVVGLTVTQSGDIGVPN